MTRPLFAVALSLLVNLPALAAEAPAAAPVVVKPQAMDLAKLLVPREGWSRSLDAIAQGAKGQLLTHLGNRSPPAGFDAKLRSEIEKILPFEDLLGMHARELSATFTDKELADILAFHRSAAGQKFMASTGAIFGKVGEATEKRFEAKIPDAMSRLAADLPKPAPAAGAKAMSSSHPAMPPADGKAAPAKPADAKPAK